MTEVDSDEDLTKELEPLAYYVHDRKRVLREALRTLKGKRLDAMIPPVLKSWDRPKLECACVNILEDVDDETLLAILDGRAGTAGVAAVELEQAEPEKQKVKKVKNKLKKQKSINDEAAPEEPKKKKKKKAALQIPEEILNDPSKLAKLKRKKKLLKAKKLKEKLKKKKKAAAAATATEGEPSSGAPAPHKSLMELLELEYRAKAIKALLKSQGQTVPDLPLDDVESENSQSGTGTGTRAENQLTNGSSVPTPPPVQESLPQPIKKSKKNVKSTTPQVSVNSPIISPAKSSTTQQPVKQKNSEATPTTDKSPKKQLKATPKKAVIDIIDDALNTSFSEISDSTVISPQKSVGPPSVIVEACATSQDSSNLKEEDLRSKLLRKLKEKQGEVETEAATATTTAVVKKKRMKKKKKIEEEDGEDILDLHPQELSLTDDEGRGGVGGGAGANQTAEEDESEEEDEESELSESENTPVKKIDVPESKVIQVKVEEMAQEEELIYDDTDEEEEEENNLGEDKVNEKMEMEGENSNLSNQENSLWAAVVEEDGSGSKQGGASISSDKEVGGGGGGGPEAVTSDNSRSGVFSETTRDDVFESVAALENLKGKGKENSVTFAFASGGGQSLMKKKLTLRIDPKRIEALKELGAEEDKKREEERKKEEEEERLRRMEEEPEEGEIDSAEDGEEGGGGEEEDNKSKKIEETYGKSRKKGGRRRGEDGGGGEGDDSDKSQDSTDNYSKKRKPYKRKDRDFGKYSPQRSVESWRKEEEKEETSKKRGSTSPVDFITQFSDMEPISDEEDDDTNERRRKKVVAGPVQGCVQRPSDHQSSEEDEEEVDEDKRGEEERKRDEGILGGGDDEEEEEGDEDELPKPVTWYERWAQSHGMSKVVKTNKIHRKVRSKLKLDKKTSQKKEPEVPKIPEPSVEAEPIIGSIEEYEKLFGKKVVVKNVEEGGDSNEGDGGAQDEEEEDADDLWGDILGGS